MGVLKYLGFAIRFLISRNVQSAEEKATDRLTIEKGYGRELYELSEIRHNDKKHKTIRQKRLLPTYVKGKNEKTCKY